MQVRRVVLSFLAVFALPLSAAQITVKTQNYINFPGTLETQTIGVSWQLFNGSTDCTTGGGPVTTVTGVDSVTGLTFDTGTATSFRLVADPNGNPMFARSEQNGPFVSWGASPGDTATINTPGDGRAMCVSGFTTNTYFARLYVGIQAFDACGNERSVFAPGETVYFRFAGGLTFNAEPHRVLAAGGSVNECTFLPEPPLYTTIHITSDPQIVPFTLPSSDAAIPPACTSSGTQHITGNWRIVAYDVPGCGCNRNQLNFTVDDTVSIPSCGITCPADIVTNTDPGACGANVSFTPPTDGSATVTCDHTSGSFFPTGTTTVTCSSSLGSSCDFDVTVNDDESPLISAPADVTASAGAACTATPAVGVPAATDNCGSPSVSGSRSDGQPLGDPYPLGTTSITWTATDAAGLTSSDTQTVTIVDTTAPSIAAPPNAEAIADIATCTKVVAVGSATATDNCGTATVSSTRSDGESLAAPYPLGTTTITWTAVDGSGNSTSATQTVKVTAAPLVVTATASQSFLWPPNHKLVPVTINATTSGGCGGVSCAITSVTSNQPVVGPGQGKDPDWIIDDATHVRLRPERTNGRTRVYTITVTCEDGGGQTSTYDVTVTVANGG